MGFSIRKCIATGKYKQEQARQPAFSWLANKFYTVIGVKSLQLKPSNLP
jgi:hypothetical protein